MENRQVLLTAVTLTICISFIISFAIFGSKAYDRVFANNGGEFAEGTMAGSVDVSGLTKQKAVNKLTKTMKTWRKNTTLTIKYKEKTEIFDLNNFSFLLDETVNDLSSGKQSSIQVEIDNNAVSLLLTDMGIETNNVDQEAFQEAILSYPSMLVNGVHTIQLEDYLLEKQADTVVSEATLPDASNSNSEQFEIWLNVFPEITIKAHSQFSLLDAVSEKKVKTLTSDGLSMVATAIYKAILPTNFNIIERSISSELPAYAEEGYEAKVNSNKNMDFVIQNPNDTDYTLTFKKVDNLLYVSVNGNEFAYKYSIVLKDRQTFAPKNIVQFDPTLPTNTQRIKTEGKDGFIITVYRNKVDSNGTVIQEEKISEDYYPPINTVIITSLLVNETATVETAPSTTNDSTTITETTESSNPSSSDNTMSTESSSTAKEANSTAN